MRQKGFALIPIIIIVLIGVIGYFVCQNIQFKKGSVVTHPTITPIITTTQNRTPPSVATNNPSKTNPIIKPSPISIANWKSYESKRFKFSFEYPQDMILDTRYENKYPDQGGINIYSKEEYAAIMSPDNAMGGGSFMELWVYPNAQNLSLLNWMKKETSYSNFNDQEYSTINIDGEQGYIYVTEGEGGSGLEAVVSKNSQIYTFGDLGYDNELKQIISTFQFAQ